MKFKLKPEPERGSTRYVLKFAWFPARVNDDDVDYVWLELYYAKQRYIMGRDSRKSRWYTLGRWTKHEGLIQQLKDDDDDA